MAIKWASKKGGIFPNRDVTVTIHRSNGKARATVIFRNSSFNKVAPSGYTELGIDGSRMYFRDAPTRNGYKMSVYNNSTQERVVATVNEGIVEWVLNSIGSYNLCQDENGYYIKGVEV